MCACVFVRGAVGAGEVVAPLITLLPLVWLSFWRKRFVVLAPLSRTVSVCLLASQCVAVCYQEQH